MKEVRMKPMHKSMICLVLLIMLNQCGSSEQFYAVSKVNVFQGKVVFYLEDGRVYTATKANNPNLQHITARELQEVRYILFKSPNEILLEGTQEDRGLVKYGRIPLKVSKTK